MRCLAGKMCGLMRSVKQAHRCRWFARADHRRCAFRSREIDVDASGPAPDPVRCAQSRQPPQGPARPLPTCPRTPPVGRSGAGVASALPQRGQH